MFLVDCHCDTLSELYKQNRSLYANDLMLDAARIIKNGGGLQFMAMFIPTEVFRAGAGATYTLKLIDTYLRGNCLTVSSIHCWLLKRAAH